jgi:hypothetical protein
MQLQCCAVGISEALRRPKCDGIISGSVPGFQDCTGCQCARLRHSVGRSAHCSRRLGKRFASRPPAW